MIALRTRRLAARLRGACEGVAAVEFALAAPVLLVLLIGMFDMGHMAYLNAVLNGAVEKVARDSALETANTTTSDQAVGAIMAGVAPGASVTTTRKSYYDFTDVARPEQWGDTNANGRCDNGESYTDENNNGSWDADIGRTGNGGSGDVVYLTATMTYQPLFKVPFTGNANGTRTLKATAVTKNQPFGNQGQYSTAARTCT
ncbi:TadE/TadG family type IV pilus assembly protein [Novosphingobium colocasiae]|uniref:TadE/TadG family type IV pilus assembly protein n=1 Tax=Novosphingobium colocasiae TaxID=1256513 RepID=UPI0035AFBB0B